MWRSPRTSLFLAARSITRGNYGVAAMTAGTVSIACLGLLFLPALAQGADAATAAGHVAVFGLLGDILRVASLLVAAITVLAITHADLARKRRQIGAARAIGIGPGTIVASYAVRALCHAAAGVGAGLALFTWAVVPLAHRWPPRLPGGPVTLASTGPQARQNLLALLVVTLVAATVPAIRAVRPRVTGPHGTDSRARSRVRRCSPGKTPTRARPRATPQDRSPRR